MFTRRFLGCLLLLTLAMPAQGGDYAAARKQMVARQLASRDIRDQQVLAAMGRVPRHEFVPFKMRGQAYGDHPLPIGQGQTISQPYIVAFMSQAVRVKPGDKVLEIGTGSGYQAAVLAAMGAKVYSVEIIPELAQRAGTLLKRLGYAVHIKVGDGNFGWPQEAPFDAILVTAAARHVPPKLVEQLKPGGRMVIPVGPGAWAEELVLVTKDSQGKVKKRSLMAVRFVPLVGGDQPK
ncbi:MAG: protein-L-isoaspartate(D-aspartate) O-methyltransferase [Desulfarculaceae bacterium]|nr:protein-L-isoaspartate(D-aspartate) O-methyltransferase [Desulfarculaceae bacterium]MCF8049113.1 protein-L-isoaspartate(D-aspartate) O-methyltransferase [Desulfarculaceae bacterium]MCF8063942.1 protein-L-isoaspartate(D-aspartate) O-methyltransferase [Desulfarculaceae bacterium]MCF8099451.1 protein-L-isoaspartate(D-aspartate) O-methyltransferase [Desulfarculaceae bacterium]MCF8122894.1 protein-L-isoaspartate(D-aspartate) O-methyltransferase [Desulfarculaceae bacterium]